MGLGLRVCSLDVAVTSATVHNRSQPSAAVCNRLREGHMAMPMVSSARAVTSGGPKRRVASFGVAGVALRDIPTCFITKIVILRGRRNTSDVSCCEMC